MDLHAIEQFKDAGVELKPLASLVRVPVHVGRDDRVVALEGEEVPVAATEQVVLVPLKPITALFAGNKKPPSFSAGPSQDYVMFFGTIEATAADCASLLRPIPTDQEFERIYRLLKRRPDGRDGNPLFSYVRAAVRLYMSLNDVSRDEFQAVVARVALTAKHFSVGPSTTNYFEMLSRMFLGNRNPQFSLPVR